MKSLRWMVVPWCLAACSEGPSRLALDVVSVDAVYEDAIYADFPRDQAPPVDVKAEDRAPIVRDVPRDTTLDPDASCLAAGVMATITRQPVDIIWAVDNSVSMAPAIDQVIRGLNSFAALVGSRGLDYRVVMLSLRNRVPETVYDGGRRYAICIPPPLAGDSACGNGPRFFHSSIDIRSTQPLEQLLGSLAQTQGYSVTDTRGGAPWRDFLRPEASKTIVVVTDDNSRMPADEFEHFAGGTNPRSSSFRLPPGLLDPFWGGLFAGYTFSAIYGYGSETNPAIACRFADGSAPANSGPEYTTLVRRTSGARAQLCLGASAWGPFFTAVATAVERASALACDVAIPPPPGGSVLDADRINVVIQGRENVALGRVGSMAACGPSGGWYYDDPMAPTRVFLCPVSCDRARAELRAGSMSGIQVQFGCQTIPG